MGVRLAIRSAEGQPLSEELAYDFEQARIVIGRGAGADVRIPHLTVSDVHATLRQQDDAYVILDNDSTNGTRVNGARVTGDRPKRLHDGDRIEVGAYAARSFASGVRVAAHRPRSSVPPSSRGGCSATRTPARASMRRASWC